MTEPLFRLLLVGRDDAGLCERARGWGDSRFAVEVLASTALDSASLDESDTLIALDAAGVSACRDSGYPFADLSSISAAEKSQGLAQQMRGKLADLPPRTFSADDDVRIESRTTLHKGFVELERIDFRHRLHTGGWSSLLARETLHRCAAVGVLPYDPARDEVLLIEQIRIAAMDDRNGPWLLELIAGLVEAGESPQQVCIRESLEEAGVVIEEPLLVADYLPSTGISDEQMLVYVARFDAGGAGGIHGLIEEGEDIRVITMPSAEAFALLQAGHISNAATIIALQWLMLNMGRLRTEWSVV